MGLIQGKNAPKAGEFSILEAFGIGIAKQVSERVLEPVIGNGTYMSGSLKIGGAVLLPRMMKGGFSKALATAWAIDGVEDVVNRFLKGTSFGNSNNGSGMTIY